MNPILSGIVVIGGVISLGLLYKAKKYVFDYQSRNGTESVIDYQSHNGKTFGNRYQFTNRGSDDGYYSPENLAGGKQKNKTNQKNKTKRKKYNNNI